MSVSRSQDLPPSWVVQWLLFTITGHHNTTNNDSVVFLKLQKLFLNTYWVMCCGDDDVIKLNKCSLNSHAHMLEEEKHSCFSFKPPISA